MTTDETQPSLPMRQEDPSAQTPMSLIQMAVQANADPDRLEKLMALQERWESNKAADAFSDSMAAFQAECPAVLKGREASFKGQKAYNFASLDDIMAVIQPLLSKHGLTVGFSATIREGNIHVICRVRKGRHVEESEASLPVPADMRVNDTQKAGAAISYAKRYALCAALNITVTDRDTDGAGLDTQTITDEQAIVLSDMCDGLPDGTKDKMVAWLQVDSIYSIPAKRFNECKAMLKKKRQQEGLE